MGQYLESGRYLTVMDVAEILQVSDRRIRNLIDTGKLPAFQMGMQWLVREDDVDALEQKRLNRLQEQMEAIALRRGAVKP